LSESDFYAPTDADVLRMENELLGFEVRFLKARLGGSAEGLGSLASLSRITHLEEAEKDLVLLLRRLGSSPLGPLMRRRRSFRTLEERYLHSSRSRVAAASPNRLANLEEAEKDLVLLLRRLGSSPLGPLMRRRRSFRTLEERYL
jgi:hypothetical protein